MSNFFYTTLRPAMYHGRGRQAPYFEGWYYKLVSKDESLRYAIIPGVILGQDGHAFIQVLDGASGRSTYHTYRPDQFWASPTDFELRIGASRFTQTEIELAVEDAQGSLHGRLSFERPAPWPVSWLSPGIMGWYAWVPRMECYHGVLSFDHAIQGSLALDGGRLDFSGGRGYIEKDWGQSFPAAWVWFQSNHFAAPGVCITASVAIIPWLGSAFRGFIIGLWLDGALYRFATYTGARIAKLAVSDERVDWLVQDRRCTLELSAARAQGGLLRGPTRLDMGKRVAETLQAEVHVRLLRRDGSLLFEGTGRHAGLEVHGDLPRLLAGT
jgi:hypothetical protein